MIEMPVVNQEQCNGCGLCIGVCCCSALILVGNVVTIIETRECDWCAECEAVCPTGAIACPFEIINEPNID